MLEFWSTLKDVYDAHVKMYQQWLSSERYIHYIFPISELEDWLLKSPECELEIFPADGKEFSCPVLATKEMIECVTTHPGFLDDALDLDGLNWNIWDMLPKKIQRVIMKTRYYRIAFESCPEYIEEYEPSLIEANGSIMVHLGFICKYSDKELLEICSS